MKPPISSFLGGLREIKGVRAPPKISHRVQTIPCLMASTTAWTSPAPIIDGTPSGKAASKIALHMASHIIFHLREILCAHTPPATFLFIPNETPLFSNLRPPSPLSFSCFPVTHSLRFCIWREHFCQDYRSFFVGFSQC